MQRIRANVRRYPDGWGEAHPLTGLMYCADCGGKMYDLDKNGQRIPDGKGGWKNHREDTTDWNDKGNVEIWRATWAAYTNRALEAAGHPALVDHRSYKRQGIDKIPSVHLGPSGQPDGETRYPHR